MSDETTTETETEQVVYPRLTDEMTKADIIGHLKEYHGVHEVDSHYLSSTTKVNKERLLKFHENQHVVLDHPEAVLVANAGRWGSGGYSGEYQLHDKTAGGNYVRGSARPPLINHRHETVLEMATADQLAAAAAARSNTPVSDKPLNVQERKVLKELVDNDFNALKSEMKAFAADNIIAKRREIEAEWASAKLQVPTFVEKYTDLKRKQDAETAALKAKHEDQRQALREKAEEKGIVFDSSQGYVKCEVKGLKDAMKQAEVENQAWLDRSLMTLERQRLTAQRQVLVSGVSKEAATILDTVPEAKTLMIDAQRQQAALQAGTTEA